MGSTKSITLDARSECLEYVVDFIETELNAIACPVDTQMQIELAVEELFVNISNYAYKGQPGKVTIYFTHPNKNMVSITLLDNGVPFNPLEQKDPDVFQPLEERNPGGLGIFLVKRTMDDVLYYYDGISNTLTISKAW
ncbi:MAG: ATP-binding protein [Spirochaetaceae bacterium]|jgi:anti-sigma regulatory factor (Ser/Thr protein kinase)|nr:ATP-binding protein [Spirochaetaceae bacterium]